MKRLLLIFVALVAISLGTTAQGLSDIQTWTWTGGSGKSYVDKATLDRRAENFNSIVNDSNSDIKLCVRKDGRKAWYSFNGGVHFMAYYEEAITQSEKKILDKEKPGWDNRDNGCGFSSYSKKNKKKYKK